MARNRTGEKRGEVQSSEPFCSHDFCTLHANFRAYQLRPTISQARGSIFNGRDDGGGSSNVPPGSQFPALCWLLHFPDFLPLVLHPFAWPLPQYFPPESPESTSMARNIIHLNDWAVCIAHCELWVPWKLVFPIVHRAIFVHFSHLRFYCTFFFLWWGRDWMKGRDRERESEWWERH